jgi:putative hemolysin
MKSEPPSTARSADALASPSRILTLPVALAVLALPLLAFGQATPSEKFASLAPSNVLLPAIVIILALILVNGLYVTAETAVELLRPSHVRALDKDDPRRDDVQRILDERARIIAGCTLMRQTTLWWLVIFSFVPSISVARSVGVGDVNTMRIIAIVGTWLLVAIPIAAVNMVVGELAPKSIAAMRPVNVAYRLRKLIFATSTIFLLPGQLIMTAANLITRRFGARASFVVSQNEAEEEIKSLAESAEAKGEIDSEERELLHSVFEFTDTIAREIMTPRVDMEALPLTTSPHEIVEMIQKTGFSRIPIFEDTDDQILGIIHAKDLLGAELDPSVDVNLRTMLRPVVFVPENKNIHDLLSELKTSRSQMAVVQDEFGGTAGLVTIEDIVEELVGEIVDEYDKESPDFVPNGTGWIVAGKFSLWDLNDKIGSTFESDEFDTVGGYVFGLFGRQPKPGEDIFEDGYRFLVNETDGRRIVSLHISAHAAPSQEITA